MWNVASGWTQWTVEEAVSRELKVLHKEDKLLVYVTFNGHTGSFVTR